MTVRHSWLQVPATTDSNPGSTTEPRFLFVCATASVIAMIAARSPCRSARMPSCVGAGTIRVMSARRISPASAVVAGSFSARMGAAGAVAASCVSNLLG